MPTSKNWSTIGIMTIGVSSNQNDVGGSAGEHQNQLKAHGGSFNDRLVQLDGLMNANMACNYSCTGISTNDASTQELSYEFGAISAEVAGGGVRVNIIPKDGGNRFSGSGFFNFANDTLQGNNVDDALRQQGVTTGRQHPADLRSERRHRRAAEEGQAVVLDGAPLLGLRADPHEHVLREEPVRLRLRCRTPTGRGPRSQHNVNDDIRLTWQISPRNKVSGYFSYRAAQDRTTGRWAARSSPTPRTCRTCRSTTSRSFTFRSTLTSKALFEAAMGNTSETWTREPVEDSETSKGYPVTEQTTGINFRAYNGNFSRNYTSLRSYRSSLTYVTGSHAMKVGFDLQEGPADTDV